MSHSKLCYRIFLCLMLTVILVVPGYRVFARYYTSDNNTISFSIQNDNVINIYDATGIQLQKAPLDWDTVIKEKEFYIATYDEEHNITLNYNTNVSVAIFIPDRESNVGNLTIKMQLPNESNKTYTAKAEYLSSKTLLYKDKGPGWIYRFYDTNGEEITIQIPGNQLYDSKVIITMSNQDVDIAGTISVKCTWA